MSGRISKDPLESRSHEPLGNEGKIEVDISTDIAGMRMQNPVMVSSGTFGYGLEYQDTLGYDTEGLGAMVLKSVTWEPRQGNPTTRCVETYGGLLNAIGLQNVGIKHLIHDHLPQLRQFNTNVIVNIAGSSVDEYAAVASELSKVPRTDFAAVEINVSCPNVREGGIQFGMTCASVSEVVSVVRRNLPDVVLITKLTPNAPNIGEIAIACIDAGSDAVSLVNTLPGMAIDIHKRRPVLANISGGLSGPAIKPVALFKVYQVAQAFRKSGVTSPIVGMGGICTPQDAIEFILAGASAVSIGTANFYNPDCCREILEGIRKYLRQSALSGGPSRLRDLVGALDTAPEPSGNRTDRESYSRRRPVYSNDPLLDLGME